MVHLLPVRLVVGASCVLALAATLVGASGAKNAPNKLSKVDHIVVIYEENHSFDNLYGGWEGVNGIQNADAAHTIQVNQAGNPFSCLLQNDVNLTAPNPLPTTCNDATIGSAAFGSAFSNTPFLIDSIIAPTDTTCPKPNGAFAAHGFLNGTGLPGGCTEDIVHRYYQEQYQIDGGRQDRYMTGSDAAGLTMGRYDTRSLPIYQYLHSKGAPHYAIADNFFQGAFGGSFLNHQVLVAARAPVFASALNDGSANDLHSVVDANGMPNNYPLYTSPLTTSLSPLVTKVKDKPLTASCNPPLGVPATPAGITCGDYAVNTIQPWYWPFSKGTADAVRLPPLTNNNIGDELSAKGVGWAWYSGGWSNADGDVGAPGWTNGSGPNCSDPNVKSGSVYPDCPDVNFQYHHQAFDYYYNYRPGTQARADHLRDEAQFISDANASRNTCHLKQVSFVKPVGEENEHPGYTSEVRGSDHLVALLQAIEDSSCANDTMVVVAYDEFGGQWDHVPPPGPGSPTAGPHDQWGPGTRIPALVFAPGLPGNFVVDHTEHDTLSILSTIEHRFDVAPLTNRDANVADLSSVFEAKRVK
jgi:acid phosphatase